MKYGPSLKKTRLNLSWSTFFEYPSLLDPIEYMSPYFLPENEGRSILQNVVISYSFKIFKTKKQMMVEVQNKENINIKPLSRHSENKWKCCWGIIILCHCRYSILMIFHSLYKRKGKFFIFVLCMKNQQLRMLFGYVKFWFDLMHSSYETSLKEQ